MTNVKDGNGVEINYFMNGQKQKEGTFNDGKKDGLWIFYNEDGTEQGCLTYRDGELVED